MVSQHDVKVTSQQKEEKSSPAEMQRKILLFRFPPGFGDFGVCISDARRKNQQDIILGIGGFGITFTQKMHLFPGQM